ncbi:MAG: hypothetical protein NTV48_02935 [Candidatus Vogelbacteria bacterium]|nr:hypothetical protein [Candidatus Vogelbacteria bacterium]
MNGISDIKKDCEEAGLGADLEGLALVAIRKRKAEIELGEVVQEYRKQRAELVASAKSKGITIPSDIASDDVANLYAN